MVRSLVLVALVFKVASAQAPAYTAGSIVNASDYSAGPFAPNSVLSIFGSNLSWYTHALAATDISGDTVPTALGGVSVYVDNWAAPLLYVSGPQINFIVPSNEIAGDVTVRVVREGVTGAAVTVTLAQVAPALFDAGTGFAIATHADGTLLTDASPAQPGEIVVIYATGLGATEPNPNPGEIPQSAASMAALGSLAISLNGNVLPSYLIKYAGATPGSAGLYQINLELPQDAGTDPTIQLAAGSQSSSGALKIAVQYVLRCNYLGPKCVPVYRLESIQETAHVLTACCCTDISRRRAGGASPASRRSGAGAGATQSRRLHA